MRRTLLLTVLLVPLALQAATAPGGAGWRAAAISSPPLSGPA